MDCTEVREKIEFYILGDVNEAQLKSISEHLSQCPNCRRLKTEYLTLLKKIQDDSGPKRTRLDFALDLRNHLRKEISRAAGQSFHRRLRWTMVITTACAVVGISILTLRFSHSTPNQISYSDTESSPIVRTSELVVGNSQGVWYPVWQLPDAQVVTASAADEIASGGGRVYVLLNHEVGNPVAAYDVRTGKPLWRTENQYSGFLAADESRVYGICARSTGEFSLVALEGRSGSILWKKNARNKSNRPWRPCKPLVLSGSRLCWTTCNRLHLFESSQGETVWSTRFSKERFLSPVCLVGRRLFVAGQQNFYCLDPDTGQIEWQIPLGENASTWRQPLLTGEKNHVFISQETRIGESRLTCVNIENQKITWSKTTARISHICAADNCLYIRSQHVHALDALTGKKIWEWPASGCGPVTCVGQKVYFSDTSQSGCLWAVNGVSGEKLWQWPGLASCTAFFRLQDLGILKTNDGTVHAIRFQG